MNKFKKLRTERNLTQKEASALVGVNIRLWQKWEAGEVSPSLKNLIKISSAFKISVDEMIKNKEDMKMNNLKKIEVTIVTLSAGDYFSEITDLGFNPESAKADAESALWRNGSKSSSASFCRGWGIEVSSEKEAEELSSAMGWEYPITMEFRNKLYAFPPDYWEEADSFGEIRK